MHKFRRGSYSIATIWAVPLCTAIPDLAIDQLIEGAGFFRMLDRNAHDVSVLVYIDIVVLADSFGFRCCVRERTVCAPE